MPSPLSITKQQRKGYDKSIRQAQSGAFLCQLVYFMIKSNFLQQKKVCTILILYNFKNILWEKYDLLGWFVFLLLVNTYLMLMTGKNPGYEMRKVTKQQWEILLKEDRLKNPGNANEKLCENGQQQQQQQINLQQQLPSHLNQANTIISLTSQSLNDEMSPSLSSPIQNQNNNNILLQNYCKFCQCIKRNRMKHCYSCGKCVMKHDHHCPWIGACVGEMNHFMFVMCLFAHTLQAVTTLYVVNFLFIIKDSQVNTFLLVL